MPTRTAIVLAAMALGLAFAWSPFTALCAVALVYVFRWAVSGVTGIERRLVLGALSAALTLRLVAVAITFLMTDPSRQPFNALFPDSTAIVARSWWIRNLWLGESIGPFYTGALYDPYGASSHYYVLAFLQLLLGPAPYGLAVLSLTVFLAGAVVLYRMVRVAYGPMPAACGLVLVLFMPTLFLWSVSVLKDPMHFFVAAVSVASAYWVFRAASWPAKIAAAMSLVLALFVLSGFRSGALVIAGGGIALGVVAYLGTRRPSVALVVAAVLLVAAAALFTRASIRARAWSALELAANRHVGHVLSEGQSYRALDPRFYVEGAASTATMTTAEAVRFVARSIVALVTVPLPWQNDARATLALIPQQVVWYLVVLLAVPGAIVAFRRDALLTWLIIGYAAVGAAVIAVNSGNIGTLVRYRDMIVPFVIWVGAVGATRSVGVRAPA